MEELFRKLITSIVWFIYHMNSATKVAFLIGSATIITNIVFSWINNNTIKKLKTIELNANIIASARIEWLETVRGHTAEFIKNYYKLMNEMMYYVDIDTQKEALANYNKSYWLLLLYYTPKEKNGKTNADHNKIVEKLKLLNMEVEFQLKTKNKMKKNNKEYEIKTGLLEIYLKNFVDESAKYFKKVWEEAKDI